MGRAIVFDLDGVLWDSGPAHERAYLRALEEVPYEGFSYAEFAGVRTDEVFRDILHRIGAPADEARVARLTQAKREQALIELERIDLEPKHSQLLDRLACRWRMGIATSASRGTLDVFLRRSGTRSLFATLLSGECVAHAKPDPGIYRKAAESLQLPPADLWVIEDAVSGVKAAVAAGCRVIGVAGTCPESDLKEAGAEAVVRSLEDIEPLLQAGL